MAYRAVYETSTAQFGGAAATFTGPYSTAVPGSTTGMAVTLPGGVLYGTCNTTGFSSTNSGIEVQVYLDGVFISSMVLRPSHSIGVHLKLSTVEFRVPVTAGAHYLAFRTVTGSTNADDYGSYSLRVQPG